MEKRTLNIWGVSIASLVVLMIVTPRIPQPQAYHDFADQRNFFGIPNTLDVVSNVPFLIAGIIGLVVCYRGNYFRLSLQGELLAWTIFYISMAAVGLGSGYYHLQPNDPRLVWDRVPMSVALASVLAIFIIERVDEKKGTMSIIPLIMAGLGSILYWRIFRDVRLYILFQLLSCLAIAAMAILLPPMYTHSIYWLWAGVFFLIGKIGELADQQIYDLTRQVIGGHTLKHLGLAMVSVFTSIMLAKRSVALKRQSVLDSLRISKSAVKTE
ncbi:PREDICTED: uncharacterized protein LOC104587065 [Nelumbo nucifera]|uniref:Uncharacterized protein LOC104587065 n=1 Tax=Nelumbo nucifera TaxID=4432 RepID=A0A1U7Z5S2_NELNU|nr:PREDICTED: uncharacterized protein LOC104587065 [Nelumbo nucifera]